MPPGSGWCLRRRKRAMTGPGNPPARNRASPSQWNQRPRRAPNTGKQARKRNARRPPGITLQPGPPQHSHGPRVELVKALLAKILLRSQLRARHARVARRAATSAKPAPASSPQHLNLAYTAASHADTMVRPMEACAVAGRQGRLYQLARSPRASAPAAGRHTHRRHQAPGSAELTAASYANARTAFGGQAHAARKTASWPGACSSKLG